MTKKAQGIPQKQASPHLPNILQLWFSVISSASLELEKEIQTLLSDTEQKRFNLTKNAYKRREFLLSRALMRHALNRTFPEQEIAWQFIEQPRSMPLVSNLPLDTYISLSHSKGMICFAISSYATGIDIEAGDKQRDYLKMADMFMSPDELKTLKHKESNVNDYFYRNWCAKEACYKALPAASQSSLTLSQISLSGLLDSEQGLHLVEGKLGEYYVAVAISRKPDKIETRYFLPGIEKNQHLEIT